MANCLPQIEAPAHSPAWHLSASLALALTMLCAVLIVLEIAIRVISPQDLAYFDSRSFRRVDPSPPHFVENIPGGSANFIGVPVTINSLGLRGEEVTTPKPPGLVRILAVGDSITFGYGVRMEDTYEKVLERLLNPTGTAQSKYEVLNGGTLGGSLSDYLHFLHEKAEVLQPDVVLIGLCMNDILVYKDVLYAPPAATVLAVKAKARTRLPVRQLNYFLLRHSQLYVLLYSGLKALFYRTGLLDMARDQSLVALEPPSLHQAEAWQSSLAMLARVSDFCQTRGYRLIVVAFPTQMQMSRADFDFYRGHDHMNLGDAALSGDPQRRLHDFASANHIELVDLLPAYRAVNSKDLYIHNRITRSDPVHPSVKGQALAATEILRKIIARSRW